MFNAPPLFKSYFFQNIFIERFLFAFWSEPLLHRRQGLFCRNGFDIGS